MERRKGEREEKRPNFLWLLLKKNFLNDWFQTSINFLQAMGASHASSLQPI